MSGKFFVRNNFRAARFIFPFMSFVVATLFALAASRSRCLLQRSTTTNG